MVLRRDVLFLFLSLFFLISGGSAASDVLLNGTNIYLATGDSFGLFQGYVLSLKSVSNDGSMWLQLTDNDKIIKSEIVYNYGTFIYNKTNKTIVSAKVDNVYSGSSEQSLVSLYIYQFVDHDKPLPDKTVMPENTVTSENSSALPRIKPPQEPLIWTLGIILVLILFYALRKLW